MAGIFKAYDIRGVYNEEINEDIAYLIGLGLANKIYNNKGKIGVSRDMRSHSPSLSTSLINGLLEGGCEVVDFGLMATPMNYWANATNSLDGSVMVTASHNPAKYNGFKVSLKGAVPIDYDTGLNQVENFVNENKNLKNKNSLKQAIIRDSKKDLTEYLNFCEKFLPTNKNYKPLKIAIDAGNGMAGYFLKEFCAKYPWIETIELYWDLDGNFPNHEADPIKAKNLADLQKAVVENNCDFGLGFDGDADRAGFVDEKGNIISSDLMTAFIAQKYLKENKGAGIIYDLRSSSIVEEVIKNNGGRPLRSRVGHSFVKRLMRKENAIFGGELSGHYYFAECFSTDSALMALIQVINILQESSLPLSQGITGFRKYYPTGELSFKVQDAQAIIEKLGISYSQYKTDYLDGLTVNADGWWFNLRASNTEPLLRLNLEAKDEKIRNTKLEEIKAQIS